ncbi:TetR/AcrR family transcriptional regulator [Actinoplanes sp. NPDC000266]
MARRTYNSEVRVRAAQETRAAVVGAAAELFAEQGYARTSVAAVAQRAGVALNTVYTSVGGKPALVEAMVETGLADEEIGEALAEIERMTDGVRILRRAAEGTGAVIRSQATMIRVLFDNRTAEPVIAEAAEVATRRYRERLDRIAERLVAVGAVKLPARRAGDILWFYLGQGAWATARDLGWEWDEATAWLGDQAIGALLTTVRGRGRAR